MVLKIRQFFKDFGVNADALPLPLGILALLRIWR
jgi:hypothetical protein